MLEVRKPKKFFATVPRIKGIDEKRRIIEHIITTGSEDRDQDSINPEGWELDEFLENPVVLFGHNHDIPPIANSLEIRKTKDALESTTIFPPIGINPLSDTVFDLNRLGFLRTWSVGFDPIEFSFVEGGNGIRFERQTLLEFSSVSVPANAEAVNLAVSKGIVGDKMLEALGWKHNIKYADHLKDHDSIGVPPKGEAKSAIFCTHANECPSVCPCTPECYCRNEGGCKSLESENHKLGILEIFEQESAVLTTQLAYHRMQQRLRKTISKSTTR